MRVLAIFIATASKAIIIVSFFTSIVNICRNLYVTLLCVHWQFVEMFIFLQGEFSAKCYRISILIHCVDQQGVKVVKLQRKITEQRVAT